MLTTQKNAGHHEIYYKYGGRPCRDIEVGQQMAIDPITFVTYRCTICSQPGCPIQNWTRLEVRRPTRELPGTPNDQSTPANRSE